MLKMTLSSPFVVALALICGIPSAAALPHAGANDLIAFERWVGDGSPDQEIWVMRPDGSGQRKLADGCCFDWSPDGQALVFEGEGIYTVKADGGGLRKVAEAGTNPDWSPDGQRIAFSDDDGIFVVSAAGGKPARVTSGSDDDPLWSPNGRKILFQRFFLLPDSNGRDIFLMNADGSGERRLTHGLGNVSPAWSPGGRKIAYTGYVGGKSRVVVMNADGSDPRVLNTLSGGGAWSPTGAWILYSVGKGAIYAIRPDGRRHRLITRGRNDEPHWSSDGRSIVFRRETKKQWDIYVMTASGKNVTNLTNSPRPLFEDVPEWSPARR